MVLPALIPLIGGLAARAVLSAGARAAGQAVAKAGAKRMGAAAAGTLAKQALAKNAPTIGANVGAVLVPTMLEAMTRGEPSAEDKAKVQEIVTRLSMQRAQEKGIPLDAAREEILAEAGPMLEKGIQAEPGLMASMATWVGGGIAGGVAGHALGGKLAKGALRPTAARTVLTKSSAPAAHPGAAPAIPGPTAQVSSVGSAAPMVAGGYAGPGGNVGPQATASFAPVGMPARAPSAMTSVDSVLQGAAAPAKKSRKGAAPAAPAAPAASAAVTNPDDILAKEAAANGLTTDQVMAELAALNAARTAGSGGAAAHPSIAALMGASL